jgi:hypothetical protein
MVDCDDWLTLVVDPLWEMLAEPATTEPPLGPARAGRCSTSSAAAAVIVAKRLRAKPDRNEERDWIDSDSATQIAHARCPRQPAFDDMATPPHH